MLLVSGLPCSARDQTDAPKLQFIEQPAPFVSTLMLHQIDNRPVVSAHGEDRVFRPWISGKRVSFQAGIRSTIASLRARQVVPA